MATLLGWKDILRPIRDGYRHLFPSPDTGPTPEERRRQRELDRLKGFAYFDTFEQLGAWTEAESDPLQRANTPLLPRPRGKGEHGGEKANVLLCHDYSGNYHDYEHAQGIGVDEEMYTCEHLQFVDTFIYFSHKLVCIPPPSWTNTLHRNGVKALGTLLIEPQTKESEHLLQRDDVNSASNGAVSFPIARKLGAIASHYNFEGWLINIEKPFSTEVWDTHLLEAFLRQLKNDLGDDKQLIWYDALTTANKVSYQNSLTPLNLPFAKACDSMLTNYCWKESDALASQQLAQNSDFPLNSIYFGIDVWAQNTSSLAHPRVTYPAKGGGGTNTGIAVSKLTDLGFAAGIFGPAWSFEHFPGRGQTIERVMWDACPLPSDLECSCGDASTRHLPDQEYPITQFAQHYPAGSETFFYTDFSRGFGRHAEEETNIIYGGKCRHSQVGTQSILPHFMKRRSNSKQGQSDINILSSRLEELEHHTHLVVEAQSISSLNRTTSEMYESWLPLFKLDMPVDGTLQLEVMFQNTLPGPDISPTFHMQLSTGIEHISLKSSEETQNVASYVISETGGDTGCRLEGIGICLRAPYMSTEPVRFLEIQEIRIISRTSLDSPRRCMISDVRVEKRGEGETAHTRLCWSYHDESDKRLLSDLPYSALTGPFSHFLLRVNGLELGRVYNLEYTLGKVLVESIRSKKVEVQVVGFGFDVCKLAESSMAVRI